MMDLEVWKWPATPDTFLGWRLSQPVKPHLSVTPKTAQLMGATSNNLDDMIRGCPSQNARGQAPNARGDPTHGAVPMVYRHVTSTSYQQDPTPHVEHATIASSLGTFYEGRGVLEEQVVNLILEQSTIEEVVASYADVLSGAATADPEAEADAETDGSEIDASETQEKTESAD